MNDTTIHTGFILLWGSVWNSIPNIFFVHSGCLKINGRLVIFIINRFLERPHAWPHTPLFMLRRGLCRSLKDSQWCFLSVGVCSGQDRWVCFCYYKSIIVKMLHCCSCSPQFFLQFKYAVLLKTCIVQKIRGNYFSGNLSRSFKMTLLFV